MFIHIADSKITSSSCQFNAECWLVPLSFFRETDFVEWIREKFLSKKASKRELPALRQLRKRFKPNELIENFARLTKKDKRDVCQRGKNVLERSMLMELLYRFCDITQPEIGRLAGGIDYSAVSQARKRLHIRMEQEPKLKKRFNKLSNQLLRLSRTKIWPHSLLPHFAFAPHADARSCPGTTKLQ